MKNKVWIIILAAFVLVMVLAAVLYPKLAEDYAENDKNSPSAETGSVSPTPSGGNETDDFTVYNTKMEAVKLSDFFGKPVVVNFWASWCGPCKSELPAFENMYKKYGDDVVFLMINLTDGQSDTPESIKKFISDNGYTFPVYYDMTFDASETYGVYSIPETLFINADGSLHDTRVGAMNGTVLENYIKTLIEKTK